jgi:4-diphosphocytidyl-2-C-methyl-D-erythritol kinase
MGGGLGGGSSDAATALHALNRSGSSAWTPRARRIGLALGADVPVFVHGRAAWAEGVGEEMRPVAAGALVSGAGAACARLHGGGLSDPELTRDSDPITMADFVAGDQANDCLAVVSRRYRPVAAAFDWLAARRRRSATDGHRCLRVLDLRVGGRRGQALGDAPRDCAAFVARGRNRSPLFG